jgi:hypothetical protein
MTKLFIALRTAAGIAALSLAIAASAPTGAAITNQPASGNQGTLVHDPGATVDGTDVKGDLGENGPQIVNFDGDTTQTASLVDMLELKNGNGQADITGAEIAGPPGNDFYPFLSGDIFLDGHAGMTWIELALTGTGNPGGGSVSFYLTDGNGIISPFLNLLLGNGDTHFGFQADGGDVITNLRFVANDPPGSIDLIKQVRITAAAAVPEPATWALMLLGFGGIGVAMRRKRRRVLAQIA